MVRCLLWFTALLPEGGEREKGGGERPDGHSKKTQEKLYGHRAAFGMRTFGNT